MRLSGTLMNYYFHCKRQCWLFGQRINLEDNSEEVRIGRILHELEAEKGGKREIAIESVKIDKLTAQYLTEIKKSDADPEAVRWQLLLYLSILKAKGIERKGRIAYHETRHQSHKTEVIELTPEYEAELLRIERAIETLLAGPAPEAVKAPMCRKCAYYEYCFI